MSKSELLALVQAKLADKLAGAEAAIHADLDPIVEAVASLEEVAPSNDEAVAALQAQVADMQVKLDAANVALNAEVALEQADQEKMAALGAKISNALAALA